MSDMVGSISAGSASSNAAALGEAAPIPSAPAQEIPTTHAAPARRGGDEVEVSQLAYYLNKLRTLPAQRHDLISSIREQIAAGTYDTPERLEGALDGLLEDLR